MKTKTLKTILRANKAVSDTMLARAEAEIKYLEQAKLGEAFTCLVEVLDELKRQDIFFYLNGAINMSALAYCAGLISVEVAEKDYFFSRFVNPYSNSSVGIQFLSVVVDIEPSKIEKALAISQEICEKSEMQDTLYLLNGTERIDCDEMYKRSKEERKSLLEITFSSSEELVRYLKNIDDVKRIDIVSDEELFKYIQSKSIDVFDNGEEYLRIMQDIKPKDINDVALALTLCDCNRKDELNNIKYFRRYGKSSHAEAVEKILQDSYDTLVYQEQAMSIICLLLGCSEFCADNIRRDWAKRGVNAKLLKEELLSKGIDVKGKSFCGCRLSDLLSKQGIVIDDDLKEVYDYMPKLYLKAHAVGRANFFLDSAKLQMRKDKLAEKREYVVCDFTIVGGEINNIYYEGKNIGHIEPTIIELAAVKVSDGEIVDKYCTCAGIADYKAWFLDFDLAPQFRGVTPTRLIGAPTLENALKKLSEFVQDATLILRDDLPYKALETLKKCGERFGINFNNKVLRIERIVQAAEVIRECLNLGETNIMKIASKMRGLCEWKSIFDEYHVAFDRDDCLGYALAFAELVIQLDMTIDMWT